MGIYLFQCGMVDFQKWFPLFPIRYYPYAFARQPSSSSHQEVESISSPLRFRLALGIALTTEEAEVTTSLGLSKKPYILLLLLLKSAPRPHHRPQPPCENPWLACWMMSDHTKKDQLS